MRDTERERQRHRQREKQTPCREPDMGLDPRFPRITPWAKGDAKLLSHLGCPRWTLFNMTDVLLKRVNLKKKKKKTDRHGGKII